MQTVGIVVPCYNEQRRLNLSAFEEHLRTNSEVCFTFVNDGSSDGTLQLLESFRQRFPDVVHVVDLQPNAGKAEAVRRGMLAAHERKPLKYIGYWDADLATPLTEIAHLHRVAQETDGCLMVLGSRVKRLGSVIERNPCRHYLGRIFATAASLTLGLPVYDTQCGAKLVSAALVPELFKEPFLSRWIFDVELLARLQQLVGRDALLAGVVEAPLREWRDPGGSKMRMTHMLKAPLELWRIRRHYAGRIGRGEHSSGEHTTNG